MCQYSVQCSRTKKSRVRYHRSPSLINCYSFSKHTEPAWKLKLELQSFFSLQLQAEPIIAIHPKIKSIGKRNPKTPKNTNISYTHKIKGEIQVLILLEIFLHHYPQKNQVIKQTDRNQIHILFHPKLPIFIS